MRPGRRTSRRRKPRDDRAEEWRSTKWRRANLGCREGHPQPPPELSEPQSQRRGCLLMMLSFLYVAFVRVVQLVRLSYCAQDDLAIEIVMLRHEVAVLQPVRLPLAGRLLRRGTPLGDRRRRGLGCCTRPVHRTNGHPGRTLTGGASHEPWAILCSHGLYAVVGEHSANPCLTTPVGGGEAPKPLQRSTQAEQDPPRGRVLLAVTGARRQMSPEMGPTESRTTNDG